MKLDRFRCLDVTLEDPEVGVTLSSSGPTLHRHPEDVESSLRRKRQQRVNEWLDQGFAEDLGGLLEVICQERR